MGKNKDARPGGLDDWSDGEMPGGKVSVVVTGGAKAFSNRGLEVRKGLIRGIWTSDWAEKGK